ncbi:MAG: hypothetical protein OHK0031_14990 [Anaerolineales bacterium]
MSEVQKNGPKIENIIFGIFSGVAALMLLITLIAVGINLSRLRKEVSAPGVVVDMVKRSTVETVNGEEIVNFYYSPVVRFSAQDGRTREVQMAEGSDRPEYERGDQVTVRYDPAHPLDARIDSPGSGALMWLLPVITGILGLAFGGAVFLAKRAIGG